MEESERNLESILQLLDNAGLTWLTDEVRQMRFGLSEPSIGPEWVARSRKTYDANRGESPFEPIESSPPQRAAELATSRDCIAFVAERIEAMAWQLEEAKRDARELGIERIQFGMEPGRGGEPEAVIELLRSLAEGIRAEELQ